MAWYAYCITEQKAFLGSVRSRRPFPVEGLSGVRTSQVFAYPSGELAVIVSEYTPGELNQQAAIEHARVVSECFRNTTVLPFRFGTVFDTDEALRLAIRANRKAFTDSVSRLKGKAVMHHKLVVKDGSLLQAMTEIELTTYVGSDYLCRLREKAARHRERQTKARALSVQVQKLFLPLDAEVSCKKGQSGAMMIDIAHLIDHTSVEKYQNRYSTAAKQLKNVELAISGPWPPYHFLPGKVRTVAS